VPLYGPTPKFMLSCSGTLIRLATGFCVAFCNASVELPPLLLDCHSTSLPGYCGWLLGYSPAPAVWSTRARPRVPTAGAIRSVGIDPTNQLQQRVTPAIPLPRGSVGLLAGCVNRAARSLSARIPNYGLFACHNEHWDLFYDVNRLGLADVPGAPKYILWDTRAHRLISIAEYRQQMSEARCSG
jgi:hypothetical protein